MKPGKKGNKKMIKNIKLLNLKAILAFIFITTVYLTKKTAKQQSAFSTHVYVASQL